MKCQLTSRIRVGSFFLPSLTYLMWYIKLWWHEFRVRISKNVGCSRFQIHFSHFQTISRMWRWSKSSKASLQLRQFSHIKLAAALGWTFGFGHWITIYLLATSFLVGILLAFYLTHCRQLRGIWLRALIFAFCELKRFICRQLSYFLLKVIKRYSSVRIKTFGRRLFYSFLYFFFFFFFAHFYRTHLSFCVPFTCSIVGLLSALFFFLLRHLLYQLAKSTIKKNIERLHVFFLFPFVSGHMKHETLCFATLISINIPIKWEIEEENRGNKKWTSSDRHRRQKLITNMPNSMKTSF